MKSSTVRRSALSKESMDVIENLANGEENYSYNNEPQQAENVNYDNQNYDNLPNEYVRTYDSKKDTTESKSKEIDLLWQSFKSAQFNSNSPVAHALGGFVFGVITTVAVLALFGVFAINNNSVEVQKIPTEAEETIVDEQQEEPVQAAEEQNTTEETKTDKVSEDVKPVKTKKYIIKDGDTVEAIIKHEYGAYTPERAEAIMKVNNLSNLDHISINQELLLPIEK